MAGVSAIAVCRRRVQSAFAVALALASAVVHSVALSISSAAHRDRDLPDWGRAARPVSLPDVLFVAKLDPTLETKCQRVFEECWDWLSLNWTGGPACQATDHCEHALCSMWKQANCETATSAQCYHVGRMCDVIRLAADDQQRNTTLFTDLAHSPRHHAMFFPDPGELATAITSAVGNMLGISPNVEETPLIFLHIPKTGGSAIEEAGAAVGIKWGMNMDRYPVELPDGSHCSYWHIPPSLLLPEVNVYEDHYDNVFCVVRHPYDRLVSEYTYRFALGQMPLEDVAAENFQRIRRSQVRAYQGVAEIPSQDDPNFSWCKPEVMNAVLQYWLKRYARGERFIEDCHLIPQAEMVGSTQEQPFCKFVIGYSNLTDNFNNLMQENNVSARIATEKVFSWANKCPELSSAVLDKTTRGLLDAIYEDDFRTLSHYF